MPLTANIHLTRVHITLAGNSATGVRAGSSGSIGGGGSRLDTRARAGEFRAYANGAVRLVTGTTRQRTHTFALRALPPADLATIHDLAGRTCLFRDSYGARFYCSFLVTDEVTIPLTGTATGPLTDVGIQITEVTYTEGG
jgi:hypothetical protein